MRVGGAVENAGQMNGGTRHPFDAFEVKDAGTSALESSAAAGVAGAGADELSFELPPAFSVPAARQHSQARPLPSDLPRTSVASSSSSSSAAATAATAAADRDEALRLQAARYAQGMTLLQQCADPAIRLEVRSVSA